MARLNNRYIKFYRIKNMLNRSVFKQILLSDLISFTAMCAIALLMNIIFFKPDEGSKWGFWDVYLLCCILIIPLLNTFNIVFIIITYYFKLFPLLLFPKCVFAESMLYFIITYTLLIQDKLEFGHLITPILEIPMVALGEVIIILFVFKILFSRQYRILKRSEKKIRDYKENNDIYAFNITLDSIFIILIIIIPLMCLAQLIFY